MVWGKLLGGTFGFLIGGPIGAVLGAALGHTFDKGMQLQLSHENAEEDLPPGDLDRIKMAFFTATFSVMGYIAKADGRVDKSEIALAEAVMSSMQLDAELRSAAIKLFNEGKGVMSTDEEAALLRVAGILGFSEYSFKQLEMLVRFSMGMDQTYAGGGPGSSDGQRRRQAGGRQKQTPQDSGRLKVGDAYKVLGVESSDDKATVKRAYRRLMSQHHPDKLVAKGLPEEMIRLATDKTQHIQKAYELLKEAKGWR